MTTQKTTDWMQFSEVAIWVGQTGAVEESRTWSATLTVRRNREPRQWSKWHRYGKNPIEAAGKVALWAEEHGP